MDIKIGLLEQSDEEQYTQYVRGKEAAMLYASLSYRNMLEELLGDKAYYLIAKHEDKIKGILPVMLHKNETYGTVANSLPYYGSNGAIIADDFEIKEKLLDAYYQLLKEHQCVAGTIITTPFEKDNAWYKERMQPTFIDMRIGQMTYLPKLCGQAGDDLLDMFHYKTRWSIRKAQKNNISVTVENAVDSLKFLYETHRENMEKIGGTAKSEKFINIFQRHFCPAKDYDIYVAYQNEKRIAALLLFYNSKTVEYYMPVILEEYRALQPLSLIIFTAMWEAVKKGFQKWDWGGTGIYQESLHRFKKRWGAQDLNYYYYTNIFDQGILGLGMDTILQSYKNYYVYPFHSGMVDENIMKLQREDEDGKA